jgi:hypothetical protein
MTSHILRALGLSLVGLMVGETIVWFAVSRWDSISAWWMIVACALPLWAFAQTYLTAGDQVPRKRAFRTILLLLSALVGGLTNYTSWVIASGTWSADVIAPEHQGFLFQMLHPWVLPALVDAGNSSSSMPLESGWIEYLLMGVAIGGGIFWWITRPQPAAKSPATTT